MANSRSKTVGQAERVVEGKVGQRPHGGKPPMVLSYGQESNPEKADIEVAWPEDDPKLSNPPGGHGRSDHAHRAM